MKILVVLIVLTFAFMSCDRMHERQSDSRIQENTEGTFHDHPEEDDRSGELKKNADESFQAYNNDLSESNKVSAIQTNLEAGLYFMYDAPLPPREKYRPALKFFRRVLSIDPANHEAIVNKDKIEEIYEMMGMEIPETQL